MVEVDATMALETLRELLIKEFKFLSGVDEGQVEDVGRELQAMRCFLKDADMRPERYNSSVVRNWVIKLKDLATRAVDILEKHAVEVASKRGTKNLKDMGESLAFHEIGEETAGILSRMAKLTKDLESIRDLERSSSFECNDDQRLLRQTYGHGIEEHFVGMKNDIDRLVLRTEKMMIGHLERFLWWFEEDHSWQKDLPTQ